MNPLHQLEGKVFSLNELLQRLQFWRQMGDTVVFTNGCFDILHTGHLHLLAGCHTLADRVVVGLNTDASVSRLKGPQRPVNPQHARALQLAANLFTDAIVMFDEDTPEKLIHAVMPDVLVKGGDWQKEQIVGSQFVESYGGRVITIPYLQGHSTTQLIERLK